MRIPSLLETAMTLGIWHNPGPATMTRILGGRFETARIRLFPTVAAMVETAKQLDESGFVDDPRYGMVRRSEARVRGAEAHLVYDEVVFIGGPTTLGDPGFLAIESIAGVGDVVRILDWRQPSERPWQLVGDLASFLHALAKELGADRARRQRNNPRPFTRMLEAQRLVHILAAGDEAMKQFLFMGLTNVIFGAQEGCLPQQTFDLVYYVDQLAALYKQTDVRR